MFCYSSLIILDVLKCRNDRYFRDYRKLPFLIEFAQDKRLIDVVKRSSASRIHPIDRDLLFASYSSGLARRSELLKLLFVLESRDYVQLAKRNSDHEIDVVLQKNNVPKDLLSKKVFESEYENIQSLMKEVKRLSSLTLDTFLEKVYGDNGVKTWGV